MSPAPTCAHRWAAAGGLRQSFEIAHEDATYELVWTRRFDVRVGGDTIGGIRPHHPFTRRSEIALPAELGLAFKVFPAALAVLMWNRDGAAAGAG